jgi:hypothetical protein
VTLQHPPASSPPAASSGPGLAAKPVSTTAALSGQCTIGYEWDTGDSATGAFIAGILPSGTGSSDPVIAYQVTLTSTSEATADVSGFAVAFYDSAGAEAGSDQETATGLITAGQSLSWTVIENHSVNGWGDDPAQQFTQTSAMPPGTASCQFIQWYANG